MAFEYITCRQCIVNNFVQKQRECGAWENENNNNNIINQCIFRKMFLGKNTDNCEYDSLTFLHINVGNVLNKFYIDFTRNILSISVGMVSF